MKVTEKNWELRVLSARKPVLVIYTAKWCAPCQRLATALGDLPACYVDVDRSPELGRHLRAVPTLEVWSGGRLRQWRVGETTREEAEKWLSSFNEET